VFTLPENVFVSNHPLIQHKLSILRDKSIEPKKFRELIREIAILLAYEATSDLTLRPKEVETPLATAHCRELTETIGLIPVLRAGLGMVQGIERLIPAARVGHIGIYRDEATLRPVEYFCKLPVDLADRDILLLDPMLATGGSAVAAIQFLIRRGARPSSIKFLCLVSCPQGIQALQEAYPEVEVFTASVDQSLNSRGYILPGLGDSVIANAA